MLICTVLCAAFHAHFTQPIVNLLKSTMWIMVRNVSGYRVNASSSAKRFQ